MLSKSNRFEVVSEEEIKNVTLHTNLLVLRDTKTGVHYLTVYYGAGGGGTTPLLDKDGKLIIS